MSYPSSTQAPALPQPPPGAQATATHPSFAGYVTPSFRGTAVGRFFTRVFRICASLQLVDQHQIEVLHVPVDEAKKDEQFLRQIWQAMGDGTEVEDKLRERLGANYSTLSLRPGSFAWRSDEHFQPELPWGLGLLAGL